MNIDEAIDALLAEEHVTVGTYVRGAGIEGYIVAHTPTGFAVNMNKRARDGRRLYKDEITDFWSPESRQWIPYEPVTEMTGSGAAGGYALPLGATPYWKTARRAIKKKKNAVK